MGQHMNIHLLLRRMPIFYCLKYIEMNNIMLQLKLSRGFASSNTHIPSQQNKNKGMLAWRKHLQTTGYLSEQDDEHVSVDGAQLSLELKTYLTQAIQNREIYMTQRGKCKLTYITILSPWSEKVLNCHLSGSLAPNSKGTI